MKMTYKKIIILIGIFMLIGLIFSKYSYASEGIKMNNAPRKSFTVASDKFADVTVKIKDGNGIASVELYSVDSNWANKKKISFSSSNVTNNQEHIYTLSHKELLKEKTHYFYIEIKDGSGNIQNSRFKVCARTKTVKGKKVGYYAIDDAPRVKGFSVSGNKMSFIVRDVGGSKYAKILDLNNNNKQIDQFTNLKKGDATVQIDISKYKAVNGRYKLKIITEDRYKVNASRTISFKLVPIEVTQVKLDKNNLSMNINEEKQLKATIEPENATNKNITWTSSDEKVATIDKSGKVKAIATGTATMTAKTDNGKEATCIVTVSEKTIKIVEATKIQLDSKEFTIYKGETKKLKATIEPQNVTNKNITWKSSNDKVATVDKSGKIKAIAAGTATITASTDNGKKATCKITVKTKTTGKSAQEWLQACEKVAKRMNGKFRFYYSGASSSYNKAIKNKNYKCDCATYVSWCLQEYGILKEGQTFYSTGKIRYSSKGTEANIKKYAKIINVNKKVKDYYTKLQPGDICCFGNPNHVNVYVGRTSDGSLIWDDAGPVTTYNKKQGSKFKKIENKVRTDSYSKNGKRVISKIIRIDFSKVK